MKSIHLSIALILGVFIQIYAQSSISAMQFERSPGSSGDWNMALTIDLSEIIRDGLAVELPGQAKIVPVKVQLNGEDLWLKQTEEAPSMDRTLTWFRDDSGRVVLRFTENRLSAGDRLVLECNANIKEVPQAEEEVAVKRLIRQGEAVRADETAFLSRTIPIIEETN